MGIGNLLFSSVLLGEMQLREKIFLPITESARGDENELKGVSSAWDTFRFDRGRRN
jgi:hypothetical protein